MAAADFFQASWGGIRLWCTRVKTTQARAIVVHSPATGDDHFVQDHGAEPYRATADLLFDDMPGESRGPVERFREFAVKVARGDEEVLIHPLDGSMLVKIDTGFESTIDEHSNIAEVSITFIKVSSIESVREAIAGTSLSAAGNAITSATEDLGTLMDVAGLDSTIPFDANAALARWAETDDVPTRQVLADVANIDTAIAGFIEVEQIEADLELWDVYVALLVLRAAFRSAAEAATMQFASLFFLRVEVPTSVLGLVVRTYGGADAEYYEAQVRALNDFETVGGMIAIGTHLAMPARRTTRIGF